MPKGNSTLATSLRNKVKAGTDSKTLLLSKSTSALNNGNNVESTTLVTNYQSGDDTRKSNNGNETSKFELSGDMPQDSELPDIIQRNFIETLNLTPKQRQDLYNSPNTFFYLRIRCSGDVPLSQLSVDASKKTLQLTASAPVLTMRTTKSNVKLDPVIPKAICLTKTGKKLSTTLSGSVYDLEVVSQKDIDKNYYFTISSQGVTLFHNKESHFTLMDQWDREFELFQRVSNIRFFKLYKRWKVQYFSNNLCLKNCNDVFSF